MHKPALTAGALFGALAVILGASGTHSLKDLLTPEIYHAFETAVNYQFYHTFALLATGIMYLSYPNKNIRLATTFFIIGILLFSGSLYAMVFLSISGTKIGPAGIITPIGGLFFILGWILLFLGIIKKTA